MFDIYLFIYLQYIFKSKVEDLHPKTYTVSIFTDLFIGQMITLAEPKLFARKTLTRVLFSVLDNCITTKFVISHRDSDFFYEE